MVDKFISQIFCHFLLLKLFNFGFHIYKIIKGFLWIIWYFLSNSFQNVIRFLFHAEFLFKLLRVLFKLFIELLKFFEESNMVFVDILDVIQIILHLLET